MKQRIASLVYFLYRVLPDRITHAVVRRVTPNYTLGVIPFVTREDGSVLLVRQSYHPDLWGAPGGLCDRGEHPVDTVVREVGEEVGLRVEVVGTARIAVDPRRHKVQFVTRCRPALGVDPDLARPTSGEIVEVRWYRPEDLPPLLEDVTDAWRELVEAEAITSAPPPRRT